MNTYIQYTEYIDLNQPELTFISLAIEPYIVQKSSVRYQSTRSKVGTQERQKQQAPRRTFMQISFRFFFFSYIKLHA